MELKEKLIGLRKEKGLSQLELAETLNISRQAVSRWEVGSAIPTTENLITLSQLYGVELAQLVGGSLEKTEPAVTASPARPLAKRKRLLAAVSILVIVILSLGALYFFFMEKHPKSSGSIPLESMESVDVSDLGEMEYEDLGQTSADESGKK